MSGAGQTDTDNGRRPPATAAGGKASRRGRGASGAGTRILFVCLGNICRSPAAEGAVRARAAEAGLALELDSAGTAGWHVGKPPYGPMIAAAARRGIDLAPLRARQFSARDFTRFDLILGMDRDNIADMERLRPAGNETPLKLFLEYAPQTGFREVPDPYHTRDFEQALDLIEAAARGLVERIGGIRTL